MLTSGPTTVVNAPPEPARARHRIASPSTTNDLRRTVSSFPDRSGGPCSAPPEAHRLGRPAAVTGSGIPARALLHSDCTRILCRSPPDGLSPGSAIPLVAHAVVHEECQLRQNRRVTITVLNPATEEPIAELEQAGVEETDAAVARAKAAFPAWRAVAPADRARLLRRLATLVEENAEELARIESRNVGKPIAGARGEIGMVAQVFHFYAGAVDKHGGETIPVAGGVAATFREPLGVVGLIVPWNFPANIASWKLGPALACGNTVVLKPAELTPLSALRLGELVPRGGDPRGRRQRPRRQGLGRRAAPRRASGRREDRVHRLDRGRAPRDAGRRRDDQARHARARRQVGQRRSSRTPTSRRRPRRRRTRSSTTPARTAARARASSSSARSTTASSSCSSRRRAA